MSAPSNRQPHIQGLRAIAVLAVVLFHAGLPIDGGFIGVDVFFVISGFVITAMLQRELQSTGRVDFVRFYIRRFKRLTPALSLTVFGTVCASALVLSPIGTQQQAAKTAIGAMLLAANGVIANTTGGYFDAAAELNPLLNIWSLSVEEQFYLGFPLLMFVAWLWAQRRGRPTHLKAAVAVVGVLSFAAAVRGSSVANVDFVLGFYSPFTRAWEFAAGALLALLPQPRWSRQGAIVTQSAGAGLLLFALGEIDGSTPFPGFKTLLPVFATVLLLSSGGRRGTAIGALLASRPMVMLGDWSYSIYLWHWPIIVLATALFPAVAHVGVLAAIASLIPALMSYRFVEQPIRARDYTRTDFPRLVMATVLVPVLAAVGVLHFADTVWKPRAQHAISADRDLVHIGYLQGCHYEPGDGGVDPKPCDWHSAASGEPVYLLGDSNAAQFEEALLGATKEPLRRLIATTTSGCPLLDVRMDGPDFPGYGATCLARNERLISWMRQQPAGVVVIGASNDYWYEPGWSVTDPNGQTVSSREAMLEVVRKGMIRVTRALESAGHRVILVQTIPHWVAPYAWDPRACSLASSLDGCVQRMPVSFDAERTAASHEMVVEVAHATGATVLDVTAQLCPNGECVTATKRLPIYRDSTHITVAMSRRLAPAFASAIR